MANDGDHYSLAFDIPGSWSQKYNLAWDRVLGLNLFHAGVAEKELAYYRSKENRFGFPLDGRARYTKLDWEFWCASMAPSRADFEVLIAPITDWVNETPARVPLPDLYWTTDGTQAGGGQARSVVGGLCFRMLTNERIWRKWSRKNEESKAL